MPGMAAAAQMFSNVGNVPPNVVRSKDHDDHHCGQRTSNRRLARYEARSRPCSTSSSSSTLKGFGT
jgi:hypothetical protein